MGYKLVNRRKLGSAVDIELCDKLAEISTVTGKPRSKLLDEAIMLLIEKYEPILAKDKDCE